ncbi:Crp/Fnr family transcriptional regulator [Pediococcus argentinicus]|uniref:Crp/Fnr family transcriptional regulator n=1 Tax=Pediococcus argentinicus TaxID=480391 RepID=UPI00070A7395|nr:Crp/Fnr family transcriptional regulator [Pediococcus argentinicus]NKZ21995.1 Crp/Fnr family transcriptional regulator [Pediococcus argentinicus]GEP19164.1 cyclic nucleotide-binding protein [Pediococcus argentinicus]
MFSHLPKHEEIQFLKRQTECRKLNKSEFNRLVKEVRIKTVRAGQSLFDQMDDLNHLYCLMDGHIKIQSFDQHAEPTFLSYLTPGSIFPIRGLKSGSYHHYRAEAICTLKVIVLPVELMRGFVISNHQFTLAVLDRMELVLRSTEKMMKRTVTSCAKLRVEQSLQVIREKYADSENGQERIPFKITIKDLATISGTTRETTGLVLKDLKSDNRLKYQKKMMCFAMNGV